MSQKILFIDRDGTLIEEPADFQIDSYDKLRLVKGVIPALLKLRDAGFQFVIVTNQDGLGTDAYPHESFDGPNNLMLQIFQSQGITFREILVDGELAGRQRAHAQAGPGPGDALPARSRHRPGRLGGDR